MYNRAQRRSMFRYGLFTQKNENGYICFSLEKINELDNSPLVCFTTKAEALGFLNSIVDKYGLCQKLCGIYPSANHCFHYEIGACQGACIGRESPVEYNLQGSENPGQILFWNQEPADHGYRQECRRTGSG